MIDSQSETLLTLKQAADELPRRRKGRKTHFSTLWRWTTSGCRGVVLESIQVGATRCTSREALARFFDALTRNAAGGDGASLKDVRTVKQRQRRSEAAGEELERLGA